MADFCLECFNKIHGTYYTRDEVIEEWGICEECREYKDCVVDFCHNIWLNTIMNREKDFFKNRNNK